MSLLIDLCAPELKAGMDHDDQNEDTQGGKNKPKLDEDHPEISATSVKPPEMCKYNKFLLCWFSVIQAMITLSWKQQDFFVMSFKMFHFSSSSL